MFLWMLGHKAHIKGEQFLDNGKNMIGDASLFSSLEWKKQGYAKFR